MRIPVRWSLFVGDFLDTVESESSRDYVECPCCSGDDFQHNEPLGYFICRRCGHRVEEADMEYAASGTSDD